MSVKLLTVFNELRTIGTILPLEFLEIKSEKENQKK